MAFTSKRPWLAPEGSWLAHKVVQGLVLWCSGMGAPERSWTGALGVSGCSQSPLKINVLMYYAFELELCNLICYLLLMLLLQTNHTAHFVKPCMINTCILLPRLAEYIQSTHWLVPCCFDQQRREFQVIRCSQEGSSFEDLAQ